MKRGNGEGTIYKRKDGRWCGAFYSEAENKRPFVYASSYKSVKEKMREKSLESTLMDSDNPEVKYSLEDWIKVYLETYKRNDLKPSTYTAYETVWRGHIKDSVIGKMNLAKIRPYNSQSFYNQKLKAGLSVKTVWKIRNLISTALKQALREGYIEKNPDEFIVLPKKQRYEPSILTPVEIRKIVEEAKDDPLYSIVVTALFTGMRKGELMALQWRNVDFENRRIFVEHNLGVLLHQEGQDGKYHNAYELGEPKSKKSKRYVPMADTVVEALRIQRARQDENRRRYAEIYKESGFVFTEEDGEIINQKGFMNRYHTFLKKYGITDCRFHDLRHSFASLMLQRGVDIKTLSDILGHSQISTSLDIYTHVYDETKAIAVEGFNNLIMGKREQPEQ